LRRGSRAPRTGRSKGDSQSGDPASGPAAGGRPSGLRRPGRRGHGGSRSDSDGSAGFGCSPGSLGGWTGVCPCRIAESLGVSADASPSTRQVRVSQWALDVHPCVEGVRLRTRAARVGLRVASSLGDEDRSPSASTCWRPVWARSSSAVSRREVVL
jgi:hypothetical protein